MSLVVAELCKGMGLQSFKDWRMPADRGTLTTKAANLVWPSKNYPAIEDEGFIQYLRSDGGLFLSMFNMGSATRDPRPESWRDCCHTCRRCLPRGATLMRTGSLM